MRISVPPRSQAFPLIIILTAALGVYINTLLNGFVYDDVFQVVKNPWITNIKYLPKIFLSKTWGFTGVGSQNYYRPMMHIVYMFDYLVFGLKSWGFHLVNACLHACVSVLVFLTALRLFAEAKQVRGNLSGSSTFSPDSMSSGAGQEAMASVHDSWSFAFIAALVFAVHPIHTEAVSWVAGLPDLAFTLFYLLSFYFFIRCSPGVKKFCLLSVTSFFISALFKETALTLPIILIAYDYVFRSRAGRAAYWRKYLPYVAAAGVYLVMRVQALGGLAPENVHRTMSVYQYVINVFPLFGEYLIKLFLPINLSALYVFHPLSSLFSAKMLLSIVIAIAFFFLMIKTARSGAIVFMSLLIIVVPLVPAFYMPAIAQPFAERYLYLPSVGFALILALVLTRLKVLLRHKVQIVPVTFLVPALVVAYSTATIRRNTVWRDSYSLWSDTARKSPDSFIAHLGLGNALLEDRGRTDDAIAQYRAALQLNPGNPDIHDNLGFAFYKKGQIDKAMEQYRIALSINPRHADTRANLGLALARLDRTEEAITQYRLAIEFDPTFADPHDYLGNAYQQRGEADRALTEFEAAVKLDPSNAAFRKDLYRARKLVSGAKGAER